MIYIIALGVALIGIIYGPQWWVKSVMARYSIERDDLPGSGGELARHLVKSLKLTGVTVGETDRGDHYDPQTKTVNLSPDNFNGRSLTAITIAAHEIGHAIQHASGYSALERRSKIVRSAAWGQRIGAGCMLIAPLLMMLTRSPIAGGLMLIGGLLSLGTGTLVHLITLPVEFDASFNRALPILETGYIKTEDMPAARKLLKAAALTYVAATLTSLLNIWAWLRLLRR